jgi:hypothetical protein
MLSNHPKERLISSWQNTGCPKTYGRSGVRAREEKPIPLDYRKKGGWQLATSLPSLVI